MLTNLEFGFRKGKSTMDAIQKVLTISDQIRKKANQHRAFCVMITIDIKSAFNSAPWKEIIKALEMAQISNYLINIIKSYLSHRAIITELKHEV